MTALNYELDQAIQEHCSCLIDNKLYIFGGSLITSSFGLKILKENECMYTVDLDSNKITKQRSPFAYACGSLTHVNDLNEIWLYGGIQYVNNSPEKVNRSFFIYNLDDLTWKKVKIKQYQAIHHGETQSNHSHRIQPPIYDFSSFYFKGEIFFFFGRLTPGVLTSDIVHVFNLRKLQWRTIDTKLQEEKNVPSPRAGHCSVYLENEGNKGSIFIMGGIDQIGRVLNDMWIFDLETMLWKEIMVSVTLPPLVYHSAFYLPFYNGICIIGGSHIYNNMSFQCSQRIYIVSNEKDEWRVYRLMEIDKKKIESRFSHTVHYRSLSMDFPVKPLRKSVDAIQLYNSSDIINEASTEHSLNRSTSSEGNNSESNDEATEECNQYEFNPRPIHKLYDDTIGSIIVVGGIRGSSKFHQKAGINMINVVPFISEKWSPFLLSLVKEFNFEYLEKLLSHQGEFVTNVSVGGSIMKTTLNNETVIIKRLVELEGQKELFAKDFVREVNIYAQLSEHHNIAKLYGIAISMKYINTVYMMVMPFYEYGSLKNVLNKYELSWYMKVFTAYQVANAMRTLHKQGFIHRDLKSENVFVNTLDFTNQLTHVVVADFGMSRKGGTGGRSRTMTLQIGTPRFTAPEILQQRRERKELGNYSNAADVFSFGMLLWEIATNQTPFSDMQFNSSVSDSIEKGNRPEIPPDCNPQYAELIRNCWDPEPSVRLDFDAITKRLRIMCCPPSPPTSHNPNRALGGSAPVPIVSQSPPTGGSWLLKSPSAELVPSSIKSFLRATLS